jgi:hypothetical protein
MKLYKGYIKSKPVDIAKFSKVNSNIWDPKFIEQAKKEAQEYHRNKNLDELSRLDQELKLYDK